VEDRHVAGVEPALRVHGVVLGPVIARDHPWPAPAARRVSGHRAGGPQPDHRAKRSASRRRKAGAPAWI
jgi:hypothetical protein